MTARHGAPHVEIRGAGPDLVLLHGWALHGGMWGPWLDELAAACAAAHRRPAGTWAQSLAARRVETLPISPAPYRHQCRRAPPCSAGRSAGWLHWSLRAADPPTSRRSCSRDDTLLPRARGLGRRHEPRGARRLCGGLGVRLQAAPLRTSSRCRPGATNAPPQALRFAQPASPRTASRIRAPWRPACILRAADLRDGLATDHCASPRDRRRARPHHARNRRARARLAAACRTLRPGRQGGPCAFPFAPRAGARRRTVFPRVSRRSCVRQPHRRSGTTRCDEFALDVGRVRSSFSKPRPTYDAAAVLQTAGARRVAGPAGGPAHAATGGGRPGRRHGPCRARAQATLPPEPGARDRPRRSACCARRAGARPCCAASTGSGPTPPRCRCATQRRHRLLQPDAAVVQRPRPGPARVPPGAAAGRGADFTTLGPDTLVELRRAWQPADPGHAHVNRFIDMHDLGDALVRAGFAEPVLDVERYTLHLRRGARPDARPEGDRRAQRHRAGRSRGLTGKSRWRGCSPPMKPIRREGKLPATYEVVFGQAWCPTGPSGKKRQPRRSRVPVREPIGRPERLAD